MRRALTILGEMDHFLLVARLTLLLTIVNNNEQPLAFALSVLACGLLFLSPVLLRAAWPWLGLGVVLGAIQFAEWYRIDDHVAVSTYWLLALGASRIADDPRSVAALSARILIACVFAFAFGWKLLSSQFVSGEFFRYQLVTDERFALVSEHVGGTSDASLTADRIATGRAVTSGSEAEAVSLAEGPRQSLVATIFTGWGLVSEAAVAVTHALPLRGRWRRLRLATLFGFAGTTYAVVPVAGFGALLMTLALASYDTRRSRPVIVTAFAAVLAWGAAFPLLA